MVSGKKVIVVLPAYNAEKTLRKTVEDIPRNIVDEIILVDDHSKDDTVAIGKKLDLKVFVHDKNLGYGANQKTCYSEALKAGADIVIMVHPDYQYDPRLVTAMSSLIGEGLYDVVIASRILGRGALKGGMPFYKYAANRVLTLFENSLIGEKLSEYHTGYRAFSREVLTTIPIMENSDDFIFDNQMLLQVLYFGFNLAEITCPTVYNAESSSINFRRSCVYGVGVVVTAFQYVFSKMGLCRAGIFEKSGRKLLI